MANAGNARCYNGCVFLCILLAWISCCVAFGNDLHAVDFSFIYGDTYSYSTETFATLYFYTDGFELDSYGSTFVYYSDVECTSDLCSYCESGGSGVNAGASLAFICCMIAMFFWIVRVSGSCAAVERTWDAQKLATGEWWLSILIMIFLSVAIGSWSDCYNETLDIYYDYAGSAVRASGWAFLITTLIFTFIAFLLLSTIKRSPSMLRWSGLAPGETVTATVVTATVVTTTVPSQPVMGQPVAQAQVVYPGGPGQPQPYYVGGQTPMYQPQYQPTQGYPAQGQPMYMPQGQPMYAPQPGGQPVYMPQGPQPNYGGPQPVYGSQPVYNPQQPPTYAQPAPGSTNGPPSY